MDDTGSIVLGWLTKLVLAFGVLGLLGFDGVALVTAHFSADDAANSAAVTAADTFRQTHDTQRAYDAAVSSAAAQRDRIDPTGFSIDTNGRVSLVLHSIAHTLWLHRVGPLSKFVLVDAQGTAQPSP